jgi:hypothetical protein
VVDCVLVTRPSPIIPTDIEYEWLTSLLPERLVPPWRAAIRELGMLRGEVVRLRDLVLSPAEQLFQSIIGGMNRTHGSAGELGGAALQRSALTALRVIRHVRTRGPVFVVRTRCPQCGAEVDTPIPHYSSRPPNRRI